MLETAELRRVLEAIERGDVTIAPVGATADEVYAGNVTYKTSNGWTLVVFNDCNSWDYLDSATAPDGRSHEYPSGLEPFYEETDQFFIAYAPPAEVIRDTYGFTR